MFSNCERTAFAIGWTHYKILIRVDNPDNIHFYIKEVIKNTWTTRQLERQIDSGLFERLLVSNDKNAVLAVARKEKPPSDVKEIINDPIGLEFLGLKNSRVTMKKTWSRPLLQICRIFCSNWVTGFLSLPGNGVFTLKETTYIYLVSHTRLLRCFVIMEIKPHKLNHKDVGQLQIYVN